MSFRCLAAKSVTRFLAASALARCGRAGAAVANGVVLAVGYNITISIIGTQKCFCNLTYTEGTARMGHSYQLTFLQRGWSWGYGIRQ